MAIAGLRDLCAPSYLYLVLSMILLLVMLFQNIGNTNVFCLGMYSCDVPSVAVVFILKVIYILFWTWILNLICRAGAPSVAWFLVLFPIILFFILIGMLLMS